MKILITGGAGFIGQHLARFLLAQGCDVTVLDNFSRQIHGDQARLPSGLAGHVRLIQADVRDGEQLARALQGQRALVHLAAETGTGQSMYEVARYTEVNLNGTANLADCLANCRPASLERIVVASSRAIYGEGAYQCAEHGQTFPGLRNPAAIMAGLFDPQCRTCRRALEPVPTPEEAPLQPSSYYGLTKQVQEQMMLMFGAWAEIPAFALRYQNVFGPGQSLRNPYTGILAIFSNLARAGEPIQIFEDGAESRDFVYIEDVVRATAACLTIDSPGGMPLNVGSGARTTVLAVAESINEFFGRRSELRITGASRAGDVRHGCAEMTRARHELGFEPAWDFAAGLRRFLEWAAEQREVKNRYHASLDEMRKLGLFHEGRKDRHRYGHLQ